MRTAAGITYMDLWSRYCRMVAHEKNYRNPLGKDAELNGQDHCLLLHDCVWHYQLTSTI